MTQPLESNRASVDEQLGFVNVVCMSLVMSVVLIAGVAYWISSSQTTFFPPVFAGGIAWGGVAVAAAMLLAAPLVRRRMLESGAPSRQTERAVTVLESFRMATLLAFILREGAAVVGLMIAVLTGEPAWCYALAAATVAAMFAGWPRREELAGLLAGATA
jgi:hypothetical protein